MAAAHPLQFCAVFRPQLLSQRLKIPPAFVKHIKALAGPPPITVSLKGPGGGVWYTDLVTVSGDFFLDAGWKDFIHDHSLQKWDFLVFRYHGDLHFDVLVFDRSACGKEAALSARPFRDRGNAEEEAVFTGPSEGTGNVAQISEDGTGEETLLGKLADVGEETLTEDGGIVREEALLVQPTQGRDSVGEETLLVRPSEGSGNAGEEGFLARTSEDGDREEAVLDRVIVKRKRGRPKKNNSVREQALLLQPTAGGDSVGEETLLVRPTEGGDDVREDTLPVGRDNEEGDNVRDGEETILVRPSEGSGNAGAERFFLTRSSEDGDREEAVLGSVDGVIVKRKRGRPKKSTGDDCVVTEAPKRKRGRPRKEPMEGLKRTRGRPRKYKVGLGGTVPPERKRGRLSKNTSDGCVNPEETLPPKEVTPCKEDHFLVKEKRQHGVRSQRRPVTTEEVDGVILKAKAFKSEYPFCVVQMYDSYVYYGFALGIPLKFARKHLPLPGGNVLLCDPSGTRWDVKYVIYRRHGCFNAGWLKFSVTNNLERGDVCVFELVKKCELRVHIFRVVEEITPLIRAYQGRRRKCFSKC